MTPSKPPPPKRPLPIATPRVAESLADEDPTSTHPGDPRVADLPGFPIVPQVDGNWDASATLTSVLPVRLGDRKFSTECDAGDALYRRGDIVTVEAEFGVMIGVVTGHHRRTLTLAKHPRILRRSTDDDGRREAGIRQREAELIERFRQIAVDVSLDAKLIRVVVQPSSGRILVVVTSEDRLDAREFLRRASASSRSRVELRQLGHRDGASVLGGVGPCGLQLCCSTFLKDFAPVTIRMAKDQSLALNPERI
ncbi:MAG: regulatory iron-sulfur-containing complex subunit RicT, partial [Polyangiaceae bacterium]